MKDEDNVTKPFELYFPRRKFIIFGESGKPVERIEVRLKESSGKTIWECLKKYINSLSKNENFTRANLFDAFYSKEASKRLRAYSYTSVDTYRCLITRLGYITSNGNGKYIKRYDIPENAPLDLIRKYAHNKKDWKEWFEPIEQRRERIEEITKEMNNKPGV
jgi:hypothetical protein